MKLSLRSLRQIIRETAKIGASPEYMKKEKVRERLQKLIVSHVAAGDIVDQSTLERFFGECEKHGEANERLALTALRMIPFEVWTKMATGLPATKKAG